MNTFRPSRARQNSLAGDIDSSGSLGLIMRSLRLIVMMLVAAVGLSGIASAQSTSPALANGEAVFVARCKSCHQPPVARAPGRVELAFRPRTDIVKALTTGVMVPMAQGLSGPEVEAVAAWLSPGPVLGSTGIDAMCKTHEPIKASASDWPSVGMDGSSGRFQRNSKLHVSDVPRLKVKWAFAMPGGGQPTVIGDWLFITNRGGQFYALDAKTGCVHWSIEGASTRTTPPVIRSSIAPSGWAIFIGADGRRLRAFDAQSGQELWKGESLGDHSAALVVGSPVVSASRIFVPFSSGEEVLAIDKSYPCCSFRGSVAAVDVATGRREWQTFMMDEPLRPTRVNSAGIQMQGPAGAPIWAAPTVDVGRRLVYAVTGDSYTDVKSDATDAIVALDMKTGSIRWRNQVTADDNFIQGCFGPTKAANCPTRLGPDFDFGASPILFGKHGGQVLVAAQKSGMVYGLNPDTGHLLWKTQVGEGSPLGGIEWGIAADERYIFVPVSDIAQLFDSIAKAAGAPPIIGYQTPGKAGLFALDPLNGKIVWNVPAPSAPCQYAGDRSGDFVRGACVRAQSAAPAVMPGVVFSGTVDGWFRAYDTSTGKIIWAFSTTAQTYDTVNGIHNQPGGGIDGMGPTIAAGMVYTMSGFNGASRTGSNGVNVLLAFSVDGR